MSSVVAPGSPRAIRWQARRDAFAKTWNIFKRDREGMIGLGIITFFALVAITAPLFIKPEYLSIKDAPYPVEQGPGANYLLGTDFYGRPILAMVAWGTRASLLIGLAATIISMVLGASLGIMAGHYRGPIGFMCDRLIEWFLVIPFLPLAIALSVIVGSYLPSLWTIIIVIGITSWPTTARLVRSQTLAIEGRPYIERARALGGGDWHLMSRHVLPNTMPLILANTTLTVSISILAETTLTFLGRGDAGAVTWGSILQDVYDHTAASRGLWWWVLAPGLAVVLVVRAFNMVGRAMERVLDPRLHQTVRGRSRALADAGTEATYGRSPA
jgi:peptide/nickel transport system permease protein